MPRRNVTVFNMLVSCPSDVMDHLDSIRIAVNHFNRHIGNEYNIFIDVKTWRDDTFPEMNSPQDSINIQLVDHCDLAIALFWTRFGTKTRSYMSGTEEEINRLKDQGKQVFLYFCDCDINPRQINQKQYDKVRKYEAKCARDGNIFYANYSSKHDLEMHFLNHLTMFFREYTKKYYNDIDNEQYQLIGADELYKTAEKCFIDSDYSTAIKLYDMSRETRTKLLGADHEKTLKSMDGLISSFSKSGDFKETIDWLNKKIEIIREIHGYNSIQVAKEFQRLAYSLDHFGEYQKSLDYFIEALRIINGFYSDSGYEIAYANCGIGYIYAKLKNFDKALMHYNIAYEYVKIHHEDCNESFIAFVYNGLGRAYCLKDYNESIAFLKRALDIRQSLYSQKFIEGWPLANTYNNIGDVHYLHGKYDEAIDFQRKALFIKEETHENDISHARSYVGIAKTFIGMKSNLNNAIDYLFRALEIRKQRIGNNSILIAEVLSLIAMAYEEMSNYEAALEFSFGAYKILKVRNINVKDAWEQLDSIYNKANIKKLDLSEWLKLRLNNLL